MKGHSSHFYSFAAVLIWSSAYVFTKIVLADFSSTSLGFLRCAIAAITLGAFLLLKRVPIPPLRDIPLFFISGAFGFSIYLVLFNHGSETINPTTVCVVVATSPIITALLARFHFKETLPILGWCSIFLAFCGVVILMLWNGSMDVSRGVIWVLAAAVSSSAYNIIQRKLAVRFSPLQVTGYSFVAGALLLVWFMPGSVTEVGQAPLSQIGLVIYLGMFPSALAYLLWTKALAISPRISTVTNYMYLTPLLSFVLEYLIMAQLPNAGTFIGGGIILGSLLLYSKAGR